MRTQSALCLDCHKEIAADIRTRHGYHGRMRNAGAGECRACHTEHKGRDADIVQLDRAQFEHKLTEFPLAGAHRALGCDGCHKPRKLWSKAPTDCVRCHRGDDVHHGQFKQSCGDCHSSMSWSGARFDHGQTAFRLSGAHLTVACNACHIGGRYTGAPQTCVGCHATDDEHRGSRGPDCGKCHNTNEWKSARFDHFKETGFALLGAHDRLDCLTCHRSGNYHQQLPKDCFGCHHADDAHARRFGAKCADCHDNDHWKPGAPYDHLGRHQFALVGAHAASPVTPATPRRPRRRNSARPARPVTAVEDPHGGKLKADVRHLSRPGQLAQRHHLRPRSEQLPAARTASVVSCAQCHASLAFVPARPRGCVDCHSAEDVHKGASAGNARAAILTNGWALWRFDHARETHFPLTGAHAQLRCADCHREPPGSGKTSPLCVACHRQDDRHQGAYGTQCERCHSTAFLEGRAVPVEALMYATGDGDRVACDD